MQRIKQLSNQMDPPQTFPSVNIGNSILKVATKIKNPQFIPYRVTASLNQEELLHLKWMIQKGNLNQDMFLIGPPSPLKRNLAMIYAMLGQREVEYVALSRDVTDADLKQRREIRNGTAYYVDQACVRAAIHGRILILDGVEKAERNVLPILNNLLENREMALDDGRFLVDPKRYDELMMNQTSKSQVQKSNLVRTSEDFIVIALGSPVPKYEGFPLDPPFRSRFQARFINFPSTEILLNSFTATGMTKVIAAATTLQNTESDQGAPIPDFPAYLNRINQLCKIVPNIDTRDFFELVYPYPFFSNADVQMKNIVFGVLDKVGLKKHQEYTTTFVKTESSLNLCERKVFLYNSHFNGEIQFQVPSGKGDRVETPFFVETKYHQSLLALILQAHAVGDFCIVGDKGTGKSLLVRKFAGLLGYQVQYFPLHKDITSRDLLQRRATTDSGDTKWENSGLITAALNGNIALLDTIDSLSPGVLGSIQQLIIDREISLPDGSLLISMERYQNLLKSYNQNPAELFRKKVLPIHPSFRVIALARLPNPFKSKENWLNAEISTMFSFIPMRPMTIKEENIVLTALFPQLDVQVIGSITKLAESIRLEKEDTLKELASNFSTRQLLRIARRMSAFPGENLYSVISKISLYPFLPMLAKDTLKHYLEKQNIKEDDSLHGHDLSLQVTQNINGLQILKIGSVQAPIVEPTNPILVPNILFYENQRQLLVLQDILKDYILGEHILLIGNQGVGKNKIVDYFLQKMKLPREYIQLHRDTTVYSLTSNPTIIDGQLVYEDSPLVRAIREGYILVVDEADKAPTYVTSVLKSLIEDGEMVLSDGRRIAAESNRLHPDIIIHPMFRMIVLANRPGYPFLGNDFYREIGDVFASHCVNNPDPDSELNLLLKYAPSIPKDVLSKLIAAFSDLRRMVDEGIINYPYSTRELVNVVKHLHQYPADGLARALQNVFDFDTEHQTRDVLREIMNKNGIPTGLESEFKVELGQITNLDEPVLLEKWRIQDESIIAQGTQWTMLNTRGPWPLLIPSTWERLEQTNGRASVFSEWLFSFKVFDTESAADVIMGSDFHLYAVSTSPVNLVIIAPDYRKKKVVSLYEFIPASRISKLTIDEIGIGKFCIHNSQENSFLVIDSLKSTIVAANLVGQQSDKDSVFVPSSNSDFRVVYQIGSSTMILIELKNLKQCEIVVPFEVESIFSYQEQKWIIQDQKGIKYLFYLEREAVRLIKIDTLDSFKKQPSIINAMGPLPMFQWINASPPDMLGAFLDTSNNHLQTITAWPRQIRDPCANKFANVQSHSSYIKKVDLFLNVIPSHDSGVNRAFLELVYWKRKQVKRIEFPITLSREARLIDSKLSDLGGKANMLPAIVKIIELPMGEVLIMDLDSVCRVYQSSSEQLIKDLKEWNKLAGSTDSGALQLQYQGNVPNSLAHSIDAKGNAGQTKGSGEGDDGRDGEGGSGNGNGGPGGGNVEERKSRNIDETFQLRNVGELAKITEAQRELHTTRFQERLKQLQMTEKDYQRYLGYKENVKREIRELRAILDTVEAKNKERIWKKNQTSGDVDEAKLIEGLAGEKSIYKIRGENTDNYFQRLPKKMYIVFDLSASMMRFNGHDGRMDRSLECALMLMEAFKGFEYKFNYQLFGHSGDGPAIDLMTRYPKTEKDMFEILNKMQGHASYCLSGDSTLLSIETAVKTITNDEADDYFVLVLSDANLHQYNISPASISNAIKSDTRVNAFMIFLGNLSNQADRLTEGLGDRSFNCFDNKDLPKIIKSIFLSTVN